MFTHDRRNLQHNAITELNTHTFPQKVRKRGNKYENRKYEKMEVLDLSHNNISQLEAGLFAGTAWKDMYVHAWCCIILYHTTCVLPSTQPHAAYNCGSGFYLNLCKLLGLVGLMLCTVATTLWQAPCHTHYVILCCVCSQTCIYEQNVGLRPRSACLTVSAMPHGPTYTIGVLFLFGCRHMQGNKLQSLNASAFAGHGGRDGLVLYVYHFPSLERCHQMSTIGLPNGIMVMQHVYPGGSDVQLGWASSQRKQAAKQHTPRAGVLLATVGLVSWLRP